MDNFGSTVSILLLVLFLVTMCSPDTIGNIGSSVVRSYNEGLSNETE